MEEKKDNSSCCSSGNAKCCCAKKLYCLLFVVAIFLLGFLLGKCGICPMSGAKVCPVAHSN